MVNTGKTGTLVKRSRSKAPRPRAAVLLLVLPNPCLKAGEESGPVKGHQPRPEGTWTFALLRERDSVEPAGEPLRLKEKVKVEAEETASALAELEAISVSDEEPSHWNRFPAAPRVGPAKSSRPPEEVPAFFGIARANLLNITAK